MIFPSPALNYLSQNLDDASPCDDQPPTHFTYTPHNTPNQTITMSDSAAATTPAPAPTGLGENKGIKFTVKTGGKTWQCVLEDRAVQYVPNLRQRLPSGPTNTPLQRAQKGRP